ncbi:MAG: molybdate ABC transporter substrate-binding protein [Phycisphaerae bacterium]
MVLTHRRPQGATRPALLAIGLAALIFSACNGTDATPSSPSGFELPWSPASLSGRNFTVPGVDNVPDIYGDVSDPDLVVFMGGNQFMVVDDLVTAFRKEHPQVKKVLVQTLPPGILQDQMKQGGLVIGKMRLSYRPDVFLAGRQRLREMQSKGSPFRRIETYTSNRLSIMVAEGNPKKISGLRDLGDGDVRVAMPNEKWEGIADLIRRAYRKAGGDDLDRRIMQEKTRNGTTMITDIHHRQTPLWILGGRADAGVTWKTEVTHQKRLGHPIDGVELPAGHNVASTSAAGVFADAPHPKAAEAFVGFLISDTGQAIYRRYGFEPPK